MRKGIKILANVIVGGLLGAIFLLLCLALLLQIESVQSWLAGQASRFVEEKTGIGLHIERLRVGFFNRVELDGFHVADFEGDTLIYAERAEVSVARLGLLGGGLIFDDARLVEGKFHLRESPRGLMNIKELVERIRNGRERQRKEHPMPIVFRRLELDNFEFWLKRNAPRKHDYGIDWADFRLKELCGALCDFTIAGPTITGAIEGLSGVEKSGFEITHLSGNLLVDNGRVALSGTEIFTAQSHLQMPSLDLSGNDWQSFKYFIDQVEMAICFEDSSVATDDIAYFAPSLRDWGLSAHDIDLDVSGTVSALRGKIRYLESEGGSTLRADLVMRGLPDVPHTRFDLLLHELRTRADDAHTLTSAILHTDLPEGVTRLLARAGTLKLSGNFYGLLSDFSASALAATDLGSLQLEASMAGQKSRDLKASASSRNFQLGHLLDLSALGNISLSASTQGHLGNQATALNFSSRVSSLGFNGVNLDNLRLDGTLTGAICQVMVECDNPWADFTLDADMDRGGSLPRYDVDLDLRRCDLHGLRLNQRDSLSQLSLLLSADVAGTTLDELTGSVRLRDALYRYNDRELTTDNLQLQASRTGRRHDLTLRSEFADGDFSSLRGYRDAFVELTSTLNRYLPDLFNEAPQGEQIPAEEALADITSIRLNVKRMGALTQAISGGLEVADSTSLNLVQNPSTGYLSLDLNSDFIEHNDLFMTQLGLSARNVADSLTLHASARDIYAGKLRMQRLAFTGGAAHNRFNLTTTFSDSASRLSGHLSFLGSLLRGENRERQIRLRVAPSHFALGEKEWQLFAPRIELDSTRVVVDRFVVRNADERLMVEGVASRSREDSIQLTLQHFDLSPLMQFAAAKGYHISGTTNGYATVKALLDQSEVTADIRIDSMKVNDRMHLPPLHLLSQWDFAQNRAGLFIVNEARRDTIIRGFYRPSERSYYARARLDSLPMAALDPVLEGVISGTEGTADAYLVLKGKGRDATLEGDIQVSDLATTVDFTRATYRVPRARIAVEENRLKVTKAELFDTERNRGTLDFELDLNHLSNIAYQLDVAPEEMLVLNTTSEDNDLFYGKIYASGHARIAGDKMGVKMDINASSGNNSVFYMPLSGSSNVSKADFVIFESGNRPDTSDYLVRRKMMFERKSRAKSKAAGNMDINMALNVHPNLDFQLVIDPTAGDLLRGSGEGLLNLHVNPRENIFEMMGDYQITDGSYLFTLQNVINKKFLIEPGSTIQWTGEPMDAMLNINAIYKLKTSLQPLLGTTTDESRNANTRTVPVECVIHLGDRLSNPSKSFSIRVPQSDSETKTAVNNILNTETTIARQFVYLLAFNSFYPENATGATGNIGAVASVATGFELLTNQLSNVVSGEDYNIILRYRPETELTGEEVDFGFSSNLINNRLFIEVEGNYVLDNKQAVNSKMSNFMGEAYITWMIDRAGNLKLKGFTQTIDRFDETQGLQETGIGIYYKEDFDNLKDLKARVKARFTNQKRKARREQRRTERAAARAGETHPAGEIEPADPQEPDPPSDY